MRVSGGWCHFGCQRTGASLGLTVLESLWTSEYRWMLGSAELYLFYCRQAMNIYFQGCQRTGASLGVCVSVSVGTIACRCHFGHQCAGVCGVARNGISLIIDRQ